MTDWEKREKVIKGLECCGFTEGEGMVNCDNCPYDGKACFTRLKTDDLALIKAQEHADFIPIDWLMKYAQLPTEFAISEWRKPDREAKIKQAKSLDKPMMLDDALELLKAQEAVEPDIAGNVEYDGHGSWWYVCGACRQPIDKGDKFCRWCGKAVKWGD